jgi:hypothetical protein
MYTVGDYLFMMYVDWRSILYNMDRARTWLPRLQHQRVLFRPWSIPAYILYHSGTTYIEQGWRCRGYQAAGAVFELTADVAARYVNRRAEPCWL